MTGHRVVDVYAWLVCVFLMVPTIIIIPMSVGPDRFLQFPPRGFTLEWYGAYFSDRDWIAATLFSLKAGVIAAILATVIGTMVALSLVRGRPPGRRAIETLVVGPIVVPHIALAVALFLVFDRLGLTGTLVGFAAAHTVLALPFAVFSVLAALRRFDPALEMAARSCGASRWRAFLHVTLPQILPGIASAALFAFIISFDEAVVSFFISDIDGKTLPRKMFEDIDYDLSPVLAAVATLLTALSVVVLLAAHWIGRRGAARGAV
jgi:mannopine transport system permease protein